MEQHTFYQLLAVAASLEPTPGSEYHRGICELIGRLRLDVRGIGERTGDNALVVAVTIKRLRGI